VNVDQLVTCSITIFEKQQLVHFSSPQKLNNIHIKQTNKGIYSDVLPEQQPLATPIRSV